jgi:hypothetical protein
MRTLDYIFAGISILSAVLALLGLCMNKIMAEFIKGLFNGLNERTAYRLGLWVNGLAAAALGGLLGGGSNIVVQILSSTGPIRWATAIEWAKGGIVPAVVGYFASSPLQKIFTQSVEVTETTTTPTSTTQIEKTLTVTKNEPPQA